VLSFFSGKIADIQKCQLTGNINSVMLILTKYVANRRIPDKVMFVFWDLAPGLSDSVEGEG
jgi:hypothetical protein